MPLEAGARKFASRALPSVSAVMPVLSDTKNTARISTPRSVAARSAGEAGNGANAAAREAGSGTAAAAGEAGNGADAAAGATVGSKGGAMRRR